MQQLQPIMAKKTNKKPAKKTNSAKKKSAAKPSAAKAKAKVKARPAKKAAAVKPKKAAAAKKGKVAAPKKAGKEKLAKAKASAKGKAKVAAKVSKAKAREVSVKAKGKKAKVEAPPVEDIDVAEVAPVEMPEELYLTDAEGRRFCRVRDCDQLAAVDGYCRYHYLLYWKKIQIRKKILTEGKLERYIEELTARYPDKFLEILRKDLRSEKEFLSAIAELEIDESAIESDMEDETQTYIDEVRGMGEPATREEEDF